MTTPQQAQDAVSAAIVTNGKGAITATVLAGVLSAIIAVFYNYIPKGNGNYYVATSVNGGNDSNDCLAASVGLTSGPCLTLGRAASVANQYDASGANITINLGTGSFDNNLTISGPQRGLGALTSYTTGYTFTYVHIKGSGSNATFLNDTSSSCGTIVANASSVVLLSSMTISKTLGCSGGATIFAQNNSLVLIGADMSFGVAPQHFHAEAGAVIEITAPYKITGNADTHWAVSTNGLILQDGYQITCSGVTAFTTFALAQSNGTIISLQPGGFTGCGGVTGYRYNVQSNGIFDANGSTTYYSNMPGNYGVRSTGGKFVPQQVPALGVCVNGVLSSRSADDIISVSFTGVNATCSITFSSAKQQSPVCTAISSAGSAISLSTNVNRVLLQGAFVNTEVINVLCQNSPD